MKTYGGKREVQIHYSSPSRYEMQVDGHLQTPATYTPFSGGCVYPRGTLFAVEKGLDIFSAENRISFVQLGIH